MANLGMRSCLAAAISILIAACMLSMNMDTTEAVPIEVYPKTSYLQKDNNLYNLPKEAKTIREEEMKKMVDFWLLANETLVLVNQVAKHEVEWLGSKPVDPVAVCILLAIVAILLMLAGWTYLLARQSNIQEKPASSVGP